MIIYKADLIAAQKIYKTNITDNNVPEAIAIQNQIESFRNESMGVLKGELWKKVRFILQPNIEIQKSRQEIANRLSDTINSELEKLIDIMNEEDYIDLSKLEESMLARNKIEKNLSNLNNQFYALNTKKNSGDITEEELRNLDYFRSEIWGCNQRIAELDKIIDKITTFEAAYESSKATISSLSQELISDFNKNLDSSKGNYISA